MKKLLILAVLGAPLVAQTLTPLVGAQARTTTLPALPSFAEPGISPDGSTIAFVSGGDIWEVPARGGDARLLVSHPATESRPLFSPDGKRARLHLDPHRQRRRLRADDRDRRRRRG